METGPSGPFPPLLGPEQNPTFHLRNKSSGEATARHEEAAWRTCWVKHYFADVAQEAVQAQFNRRMGFFKCSEHEVSDGKHSNSEASPEKDSAILVLNKPPKVPMKGHLPPTGLGGGGGPRDRTRRTRHDEASLSFSLFLLVGPSSQVATASRHLTSRHAGRGGGGGGRHERSAWRQRPRPWPELFSSSSAEVVHESSSVTDNPQRGRQQAQLDVVVSCRPCCRGARARVSRAAAAAAGGSSRDATRKMRTRDSRGGRPGEQ
ncbi:hypothetical protein C2845_PM06G18090 [Panicum miliaceum]|uniref:Uncharacterized protein n=1 Tax=Panicum miliaceum TaxID=4540 RepID=A0A3L6RCG9_PANMI|nr:hypothetical protein C2845_PM06G18090 [Panicum miliaceum]